ncbi:MAG: carbohydrate ABC transporter permease, partial [Spirochaetaceae bacterium]|nr:carbohydrate ABC transporter permease [Spirochaetaceae bacterium]
MTTDLRFRGAGPGRKAVVLLVEILLCAYALLVFYPLANMVLSSFRSTRDILRAPFALPTAFDLANYRAVWVDKGFGRYFLNSLRITAASMSLVLLLGSMAAYGVSRYKYRLSTLVYMLFLSGIMLPLKAAIIPLFILMKKLSLVDKPLSVILIFVAMGLPSTVFILAGFMKSVPIDLEHAARIDGCNDWGIYRRIVMPVVAPAISLVTIYNAVPIWNDFFFPLVFLQSDKWKTLPVGLTSFFGQHSTNWSLLFTGLTIAVLPVLVLYLFMAKYF